MVRLLQKGYGCPCPNKAFGRLATGSFHREGRDRDGQRRADAGIGIREILNAPAIFKVLRSRMSSPARSETLYVIKGLTFNGVDVYTKGKILKKQGIDVFYVLISSKGSSDI